MFTKEEKEVLAKQYTPLVHKIAHQISVNSPATYDDCVGYGYEGLLRAMDKYKEGMGQTFKQFAAYIIRWVMINKSTHEGRIVKYSNYSQAKERKEDNPIHAVKSIDYRVGADGEIQYNINEPSEEMDFCKMNALNDLYSFMDKNFSERNRTIFYMVYGLKNYPVMTSTDVARHFGVTSPCITLSCQRMIKKIRKNEELLDSLTSLL